MRGRVCLLSSFLSGGKGGNKQQAEVMGWPCSSGQPLCKSRVRAAWPGAGWGDAGEGRAAGHGGSNGSLVSQLCEADCEEEGVWMRSSGIVWRCSWPAWTGGR